MMQKGHLGKIATTTAGSHGRCRHRFLEQGVHALMRSPIDVLSIRKKNELNFVVLLKRGILFQLRKVTWFRGKGL